MNILVLILVLLVVVLVFIPGVVFLIIWFKGFNKRCIMVKQQGENLDYADFKFVRCKVVKDNKYGEIIRFFPGSGYDIAKRFESKYWYPLLYKGKVFDTIILHPEHDNYRPCVLKNNYLSVSDIDNSEFLLFKDVARAGWNEENKLYAIIVTSFVIFLLIFGLACLFTILYMMRSNLLDYALLTSKEVVPLA